MKVVATAEYMGGQLVLRECEKGYEVGTVGVEYMNNMEVFQDLEAALLEFNAWLLEYYCTDERG